MQVLTLRVGAFLRTRWRGVLAAAAVVAVVSAAVLAVGAGARRTATAPDRWTSAAGGDPEAAVYQAYGPPMTEAVRALPAVRELRAMTFVGFEPVDADGTIVLDPNTFAGETMPGTRLVSGRWADQSNPEEAVANRAFLEALGLRVGDRVRVRALTQDQSDRTAFWEEPAGPGLDVRVVGETFSPDELDDPSPSVMYTRAAMALPEVGVVATIMGIRLAEGATPDDLRAQLDDLPGGDQLYLEAPRIVTSSVRLAVGAQASALWLVAAVLGLAAVVVLGVVLSRSSRVPLAEQRSLAAVGTRRSAMVAEELVRAALPLAAGLVAGVLLAVALSGRFPAGFGRALDPSPGLRVEWLVLLPVAAALAIGSLGWVALAAAVSLRRVRAERPSALVEAAAGTAPSPASATGVRFALLPRRPDGSSTLATVVGLALILAGVVGATVYAMSADRLVSERSRFGFNFDAYFGNPFQPATSDLVQPVLDDPDVAGAVAFGTGSVRVGDAEVTALGMDQRRGGLGPPVLRGRLPSGPDEVALGATTARNLGVAVGDPIEVEGPAGSVDGRVTGVVVVPGVGFGSGVGTGMVLTFDGLAALDPGASRNLVAVTLRPGADRDAALARLEQATASAADLDSVPADIRNLDRLASVPWLLAAVLALLGAVALVHSLLASVRCRRRDLAVLRTLGASPGWVARAVHWQATTLAVVPLLAAIPAGIVLGRTVFRALAGRMGAVDEPVTGVAAAVAVFLASVVLANLAAVWPGWRARRTHPARLLRPE